MYSLRSFGKSWFLLTTISKIVRFHPAKDGTNTVFTGPKLY
jgi:hypothetical protein